MPQYRKTSEIQTLSVSTTKGKVSQFIGILRIDQTIYKTMKIVRRKLYVKERQLNNHKKIL